METIELNHQSSLKNNMNSSNNSTTSTTSIKIEEYQTNMIIHEEIEEVPQEEEIFEKLQDEIDMIELKLKKDITSFEKENLLFQQVKCKCQVGAFCGEKTSYKSCRKVRQDMENAMGEFSAKYCFIVFTGIETNGNIFIIPTLINQSKYFKVSYSTYNFICYEVSRESNIICQNLKLSSNTSIPNDESNNVSSNNSIVLQAISNANQKVSNNMSVAQNYMSSSNPKSTKQSNFMSSSLGSNSSARKNSLNFQKKDNNSNQKRQSTLYLQQQIINDENRLKKQLQQQEKYKSTLIHTDDIPSRDEMLKIAKNYTKFIGKENLRKPFTCKEYAQAIQKAFHNKGIYPKMVIVKREPQGDFFWDYSCDNEVTLHTWDMFKNQERGVAVVV